jgi:hypothetical protein
MPISAEPSPAEPTWHRRSKGAMAGGIVMTSIGPLVALVGAALVASASDRCAREYSRESLSGESDFEGCVSTRETGGYVVAATGIAITAVGIPLIIWGAKKEPNLPEAAGSISTWVSPSSAGLRLRLSL